MIFLFYFRLFIEYIWYNFSQGGETMKANQVMEILQISRSTLKRYREKGFIKAVQKPTG